MSSREPGVILSHSRDLVELLFGLCSAGAFFSVKPSARRPDVMTHRFYLTGTDAQRKAEADAIVLSMGATARCEGGFYRASKPGSGGSTIELLFVPPIPAPPDSGDDA